MNGIETIFRRKVGQKTRWIYTEEAAEALAEMYKVHSKWEPIAGRIGVSTQNLSVYVVKLRQMGFFPGGGDLEPIRNAEVDADGYEIEPDKAPALVEVKTPLAESELVRLQRQRIDTLEMMLRDIRELITRGLKER